MKKNPHILLILLLLVTVFLTSAGCVQVQQNKESCGSEVLAVTYVEHSYLWGNDGFMTKRYDITVYALGFPSVKTDISKYEFDAYKQSYCSASNNMNLPTPTTPTKTVITTIRTPAPAPIPIIQRQITDGFWCRDTTMNIGKAPTDVRECYQFFSDGTFKWGYSPGRFMGKSQSCSSPNVKCEYSLNAKGQFEVQGGYFYTLSGDLLIDPHDPPQFKWSSTGIP